jgi:hypothetical protein
MAEHSPFRQARSLSNHHLRRTAYQTKDVAQCPDLPACPKYVLLSSPTAVDQRVLMVLTIAKHALYVLALHDLRLLADFPKFLLVPAVVKHDAERPLDQQTARHLRQPYLCPDMFRVT